MLMGEKQLLKDIADKLNTAIRLLALNVTLNKKQNEQIEILSNAGLKPKDIADILGTTANTVRVALHMIKKKGKGKAKS
jgi:DNA-binding CsgD family transcriptional regulator